MSREHVIARELHQTLVLHPYLILSLFSTTSYDQRSLMRGATSDLTQDPVVPFPVMPCTACQCMACSTVNLWVCASRVIRMNNNSSGHVESPHLHRRYIQISTEVHSQPLAINNVGVQDCLGTYMYCWYTLQYYRQPVLVMVWALSQWLF